MADLLGLSARFIDEGVYEGPGSVNRVTGELSEVCLLYTSPSPRDS